MRKQIKPMFVSAIITVFMAATLFLPGLICAGDLEPSGPPGPTMYKLVAPLPTGFVLWADNTRFAVSDEGTPGDTSDDVVLDRATGLMWARDANLANGSKTWQEALDYCNDLNLGRSSKLATDWRLPSIGELTRLSEPYPSTGTPALPDGHPFVNVRTDFYWSSTTYEDGTGHAWYVRMSNGSADGYNLKPNGNYVWPVRAGK
jgi:hypothetical protein